MTLSSTLNPALRNLSVRTHSFSRRLMVEPSILHTNVWGPRSGVGHQSIRCQTIPSCITESSPSMRHPILIWANYMTKPRSHMGVNVVAQGRVGRHSTRTQCAFFIKPPFYISPLQHRHLGTPQSTQGFSNKFWIDKSFSHPIVWKRISIQYLKVSK